MKFCALSNSIRKSLNQVYLTNALDENTSLSCILATSESMDRTVFMEQEGARAPLPDTEPASVLECPVLPVEEAREEMLGTRSTQL